LIGTNSKEGHARFKVGRRKGLVKIGSWQQAFYHYAEMMFLTNDLKKIFFVRNWPIMSCGLIRPHINCFAYSRALSLRLCPQRERRHRRSAAPDRKFEDIIDGGQSGLLQFVHGEVADRPVVLPP